MRYLNSQRSFCFFVFRSIALLAMTAIWTQSARATNFGYSVNIDFYVDQPIRGAAGNFTDAVWNNVNAREPGEPLILLADRNGKPTQTRAILDWSSNGFDRSLGNQASQLGDRDMMDGYLRSPSAVLLKNLDLVVPDRENMLVSVILYTHGGVPGAVGNYRVNGREQSRIDSANFDGKFVPGRVGNMLVFRDIKADNLLVETSGFAPLNAMSLVYCRSGDFDGDGTVDVEDLNDLNDAVKHGTGTRKYDVNLDLEVNWDDMMSFIKCAKGTCVGDANLDGVFDSSDLIQLFQGGLYETGKDATWETGDWNGDCRFDSSDMLLAFQEGCYEGDGTFSQGNAFSSPSLPTVPEPSAWVLSGLALLGLPALSRDRRRT